MIDDILQSCGRLKRRTTSERTQWSRSVLDMERRKTARHNIGLLFCSTEVNFDQHQLKLPLYTSSFPLPFPLPSLSLCPSISVSATLQVVMKRTFHTIKEIRMSNTFPQLHQNVTETSSVWPTTTSTAAAAALKRIYSIYTYTEQTVCSHWRLR